MRRKIINWVRVLAVVFCLAALCYGLTYDAADKATFQNAYAWSGHPQKDKAWDWAVEMQALTEAGIQLGTGKIFYVDSGVVNEGNGSSWARAKDTLDEAVNLCTGARGDVIFVAQDHNEAMGAAADEVDIDVEGVSVVGIGNGNMRPLFNWTSNIGTGSFNVGADGITIYNLRLNSGAADCNEAINIAAGSTDWTIIGCDFTATTEGTHEFKACIDSVGAASDRGIITGCNFNMAAGAAVAAVQFLDVDYARITGCTVSGDYSSGGFYNLTTASNHILIEGNRVYNGTIGGTTGLNTVAGISLKADTTGNIVNNVVVCNVATSDLAIVAADCYLSGNTYNETEGGLADAVSIGLVPGQTYVSKMTMAAADDDDLFDIVGGSILITNLIFYTTGDCDGTNTWTIVIDATDGQDVEFTSAVDIAAVNDGDRIIFTDANPGVLTILAQTANVGSASLMTGWYCEAGMLEVTNDNSAQAGTFDVFMTYIPLEEGVTVTPK